MTTHHKHSEEDITYGKIKSDFLGYANVQMSIIKSSISSIQDERAKEINILLISCLSTGSAILHLCDRQELFFNEAIMLFRVLVEKCTNYAYLTFCDEQEYQNYHRYAQYVSYSALEKSFEFEDGSILKIAHTGKEFLDKELDSNTELEDLAEDLARFRKQRKRDWTTVSSPKSRIKAIYQKYKKLGQLLGLMYASYEQQASEAIHGTLYGTMHHLIPNILAERPNNSMKLEYDVIREAIILSWEIGELFTQMLEFINATLPTQNFEQFLDAARKNSEQATTYMKIILEDKFDETRNQAS